MSVKKERIVFWDVCDDLFLGQTKFVLFVVPFLIYIGTFFVPNDYLAILPNNADAQEKYSEFFTAKITYIADILGIYYTAILIFPFITYLIKGISPKTKRKIHRIRVKSTDTGGLSDRKLAIFGVCVPLLNLLYTFFGGGPSLKYPMLYVFFHSSTEVYFLSLYALNFLFIFIYICLFGLWEANQ